MASDWRMRGIKRRDERNTKKEIRPPASNKKNTKKWCKGVEGREHKPECVPHKSLTDWWLLECTACGKQLDYYYDSSWIRPPRSPPSWLKR